MGRYIAPPNPYEEFETGCLRVYYPDNLFFFLALMGQIETLERRWSWETFGDVSAAEAVAAVWKTHNEMTRETRYDGCLDTGDCEQTIIDLQIQIDLLNEQIQEYENMVINVNCNCCCGDGTQLPNPNNYPLLPTDPNDPLGENVPTWDTASQTPPDGYDDWESFVSDRCRAANWFVDSYIEFVENLDLAERKISIGAAVFDVAALLLAAVPGPVGDWAGAAVVVRWVTSIVKVLSEVVDDLEELGDWLQISVDSIKADKDKLICAAYLSSDVEYLREVFLTFFAGYISPELTAAGYSSSVVDTMRDLLRPLAEDLARKMADGFANMKIPDDYVPSHDCSSCTPLSPGGFSLVPATIVAVYPAAGTGVSGLVPSFDAETGTLEFTATGPNRTARLDVELAAPPALLPGESYIGVQFNATEELNILDGRFGVSTGTVTAEDIWGFVQANFSESDPINVTRADVGYPLSVPGEQVAQSNSVNIVAGRDRAAVTCESAAAGACRASWTNWYWIRKNSV